MQFTFFWVAIMWTSRQYRVGLNYLLADVGGFHTLLKKISFKGCLHVHTGIWEKSTGHSRIHKSEPTLGYFEISHTIKL